jgi:hypothetical protein
MSTSLAPGTREPSGTVVLPARPGRPGGGSSGKHRGRAGGGPPGYPGRHRRSADTQQEPELAAKAVALC